MIGNYIGAPIGGVIISIADATEASFAAAGSSTSSFIGAATAAASFAVAGSATAAFLAPASGSSFEVAGSSSATGTMFADRTFLRVTVTTTKPARTLITA